MGEDLELVAPHDRDQRDAGALGLRDGELCRHRDGGQEAAAHHGRLLDQLDRHPAGEDEKTARRVDPLARQMPGVGTSGSICAQAGASFNVTTVVTATLNPNFNRVDVQVRDAGDADVLAAARAAVDRAKQTLGERGPVWWTDGASDENRRLVRNSSYRDWWEGRSVVGATGIEPVTPPV